MFDRVEVFGVAAAFDGCDVAGLEVGEGFAHVDDLQAFLFLLGHWDGK